MVIGGLDPSMSNFGMCKYFTKTKHLDLRLAETEPSKIKTVRKNSDDLERARKLQKAMIGFLSDVDVVCVEIPVGSQSARAMASYGMCIGIIASLNVPLIQVTPAEVKIAACGKKTASKKMMIDWAVSAYPKAEWLKLKDRYLNKNEHLADALGAVVAGVKTDTFKLLNRKGNEH